MGFLNQLAAIGLSLLFLSIATYARQPHKTKSNLVSQPQITEHQISELRKIASSDQENQKVHFPSPNDPEYYRSCFDRSHQSKNRCQ